MRYYRLTEGQLAYLLATDLEFSALSAAGVGDWEGIDEVEWPSHYEVEDLMKKYEEIN